MQVNYQTDQSETLQLHLTPNPDGSYSAHIGERHYAIQILHKGEHQIILQINETRQVIYIGSQNGSHYVHLNNKTIHIQKAKPKASGGRGEHEGDLTAAMPGQVTEILVQVGDQVETGQTLLLLEAMKMELRIKAAHAGTVAEILCQVGDAVERGQTLIEVLASELDAP